MEPFETIESAQEFLDLLIEAVEESRRDMTAEIALAERSPEERRLEALRLVAMKLDKLELHMTKSRRILSDLRMLRRLLLGERSPAELNSYAVRASAE